MFILQCEKSDEIKTDRYTFPLVSNANPAGMRRFADVLWRSPKGPNVLDLQGTFKGLLGDQENNLIKKVFFNIQKF